MVETMSLVNFDATPIEPSTGVKIASQAWLSGLNGYALANKISGYILGILIAIFIIVGIGLIVKHVIDKRSDKKMLITGILIMVIGAAICSILLGVLQNVVFPKAVHQLYLDGVDAKYFEKDVTASTTYKADSIFTAQQLADIKAIFTKFKTALDAK